MDDSQKSASQDFVPQNVKLFTEPLAESEDDEPPPSPNKSKPDNNKKPVSPLKSVAPRSRKSSAAKTPELTLYDVLQSGELALLVVLFTSSSSEFFTRCISMLVPLCMGIFDRTRTDELTGEVILALNVPASEFKRYRLVSWAEELASFGTGTGWPSIRPVSHVGFHLRSPCHSV